MIVSLPTDAQQAPSTDSTGYWTLDSAGRVHAFGDAPHLGDLGPRSAFVDAIDLAPHPAAAGYWILTSDGSVHGFGGSAHLGDLRSHPLAPFERAVAISGTPSGNGYWLFTNIGRVVAFGDAVHRGDLISTGVSGSLQGNVVHGDSTPHGGGYYLVGADGGVFAFGDARYRGSMAGAPLNAPMGGVLADPDGEGYWLVGTDGGVFAFDAAFGGSAATSELAAPVVGMVRYGNGYLLGASDGGVFNFSDWPFLGSLGGQAIPHPVTAVAVPPPGVTGRVESAGAHAALGIFKPGGRDSAYLAHERWLGRETDYWMTFVGGEGTWAQAVTNFTGVIRDERLLHADRTAVVSIGLTMAAGSRTDSRAGPLLNAAASGLNDHYWRRIARHIVDSGLTGHFPDGRPKLVMRLGWEHNGTWFAWSSAEGRSELFKRAYRRAVHTVEAITGDLTWEWGSSPYISSPSQIMAAYPGDDVVDVVGVSIYDAGGGYEPCGGDRCPERRQLAWHRVLTGGRSQAGLQWFADFSRSRGKYFAVGEWGVYRAGRHPENGGGDNPGFIRNLYTFLDAQPNLLYANYFETTKWESDHRLSPKGASGAGAVAGSSFPAAAQEFLRLFGR